MTGLPGTGPRVRLVARTDGGVERPMLVWDAGPGWRMISTGVVGGGIGRRAWWLNASVARDYARTDPDVHVRELARQFGLAPGARLAPGTGPDGDAAGPDGDPGVGMLTAADVRYRTTADDDGVHVVATVGLGVPVPAAAPAAVIAREVVPVVGTINLLAVLPVPLSDAALVNAVVTATEAKTQALADHGVPGTGTASDAVCVACPVPDGDVPAEPFAGPRSTWGARLARAVHGAVGAGTADWIARHPDGDPHRLWRP